MEPISGKYNKQNLIIHTVLDELWDVWRKADPEPDTDEEFVTWLVDPNRDGQGESSLALAVQ